VILKSQLSVRDRVVGTHRAGEWTLRRVARLRHTDEGWLVEGADRNGRWYPCDHLPTVPSLDEALAVLDDPRNAFWG
jgi:hypothetical protein